jgi:hypothetical protein
MNRRYGLRDRFTAGLLALAVLGAVPRPLAAQALPQTGPPYVPTAEDYADCRGEKAGAIVRHTDARGQVVKRCTPSASGLVALPQGSPAPPAPPPQAGLVYAPTAQDYADCHNKKTGTFVRGTAAAGAVVKRCALSSKGMVALPAGAQLPPGSK